MIQELAERIETLRQEVEWLKQQNKAIWETLEALSKLPSNKEELNKAERLKIRLQGRFNG